MSSSSNCDFPFPVDPSYSDYSFIFDGNKREIEPLVLDLDAWKILIESHHKFNYVKGNNRHKLMSYNVAKSVVDHFFPHKIHSSELHFGYEEKEKKTDADQYAVAVVKHLFMTRMINLCLMKYWTSEDKETRTKWREHALEVLKSAFSKKKYLSQQIR